MRRSGVHLLAYADRLGGTISSLGDLLANSLQEFSGVHLLPFFVPFDGDDAGFDPVDHTTVDPRLGSWDDVGALEAQGLDVTADLIVNHVSASSAEFQDWLARGEDSAHDGMFLTFDSVLGDRADEATITAFYRPRPGLPFTAYARHDGSRSLVWTTFMGSQVDIDVTHPAGEKYLKGVIQALAEGGVKIVRIDAVGYAIKTPGTDSFMTKETLEFVSVLSRWCHEVGLEVLVEVHAHYTQQLKIAATVDWVYDFALAPLLLHSLGTGTTGTLKKWLKIRPTNAITVLDTHDGIGIIDAGPSGSLPGLIDKAEMASIFARAAVTTDGLSTESSVIPQWASIPHQINTTFPSVCGDDDAYVMCRAVQMFLPGLPQVYYVGLLNGGNDVELYERSGQGRDVNRHHYRDGEVQSALQQPVTRAILALARLRSHHPAFEGDFVWKANGESGLTLAWRSGGSSLTLTFDVRASTIELLEGEQVIAHDVASLAALRDAMPGGLPMSSLDAPGLTR